MEEKGADSRDPRAFGGVKVGVDVPLNARKALKPSPKTLPKPRERARSVIEVLGSPVNKAAVGERSRVGSLSTAVKPTAVNEWKIKALNYHDQVVHEVERLLQYVEDKEAADKARDILQNARIPPGNRYKTSPEKFLKQAEQVVTILQRIQLQHPPVLQPPPT